MSNDFDSKLINLIKANRILYTKELRSNPYAGERKKLELWRHIATSLGCETKYCILRWKYLQAKNQPQKQKLGKQTGVISFLQKSHRYKVRKENQFKNNERQIFPMDAEQQVIETICDDDELQETMDEQSISQSNSAPVNNNQHNATLKRIEALLEGLGIENRQKAENHIIAYLCKCQLRTLNNEEIDNIYM
ncbi:uncharacterized protein LOC119645105 [Glossina fuscipes]|uniref:Uncharacterized protein LOC119645105 n=1 Tax=Glossina fuscipes TaxID=7396 RepID=A0A9C5ZL29_9MUSC|nr:uncharacterized protein LOC119645105 [Glossina fuscipes]